MKDGREIRRFVTVMGDGRRSILFVESILLPDAHYGELRAAYKVLAKAWRPGRPVDLASKDNQALDVWLSSRTSAEERQRTSGYFVNTSKTLSLSSGGSTVSYELDTPGKLPDDAYEPGAMDRTPRPMAKKVAPQKVLARPTSERHFYHRLAPSYLEELAIAREATKWLEERWRRMSAEFSREFAELEASMEAERRTRERIAPVEEGTAFADLPPESQRALRLEFEHNWSRMGFPNTNIALRFLEGSRAGRTDTVFHARNGGTHSDGTRYQVIEVTPRL